MAAFLYWLLLQIKLFNVILQVLGGHHFHLLAFHVIQGNQVIVRGDKRKTVESVLNCLKVSCIETKQFCHKQAFRPSVPLLAC